MKTIILAAGYATRLYPLTLDRPKALLPINGKPIIDYILDEIITLKAADAIYVVTNDKFHSQFYKWSKTAKTDIPIGVLNDLTDDEDSKRGAIGDIAYTIDAYGIDDETLIIAGDNFFTFKLLDYYNFYRAKAADCVCAKVFDDKERLRHFAVATVDSTERITELIEKPRNPTSNLAVYATYFYTRETVSMFAQYLEEGNNPDAPGHFPEWLYKRKPVYAYRMNGDCYDIGTPQQYDEVNKMFL